MAKKKKKRVVSANKVNARNFYKKVSKMGLAMRTGLVMKKGK